MERALYIAMTGARENMLAQSVHANNLANANTNGFREDFVVAHAQGVYFGDGLPSSAFAMASNPGTNFEAGPLIETGNSLDIAVDGDSWIAVENERGEEVYSRSGSLSVDTAGMLRDGKGRPVLGNGGAPIVVPPNEKLEIGIDGSITVRGLGQGPEVLVTVDRIKLVSPERDSLIKNADGDIQLKGGGQADADGAARLVTGFVEGSNVDTVTALTEMLALSRQFEMQVKMMKTVEEADEASSRLLQM